MQPIRVFIVDDAAAVRRLVSLALSNDPAIQVIGDAENGRVALDEIPRVKPDVVVLDVKMPVMDGIETLVEIRRRHPRLVVIMFSAYTQDGAVLTLEALRLGAADYLMKPALSGSAHETIQCIGEQLAPKIKALCPQKPSAEAVESDIKPTPALPLAKARHSGCVGVVAVGASVGGPEALRKLFEQLPADFPVPIVIVQHMPAVFTKQFANTLAGISKMSVCEAQTGQVLQAANAWIAPGDHHMVLVRKDDEYTIRTHQKPPVNSCRPAVDELFLSVAKLYGSRALALVLTGMGEDGLDGCRAIAEAGGQVWVQDRSSSVVWGMPGCVAKAGLAHRVLALDRIADELLRAVSVDRPSPHVVPVQPVNHRE